MSAVRGGDWHKNRIRIVGIASVLLALLVYLLWPSGARRPPDTTLFVELVYEHTFGQFPSDFAPAPDPLVGYVWDESSATLHPSTGEAPGTPPPVTIGRRITAHTERHSPSRQELIRFDGDAWSWDTGEALDIEGLGPTALLRAQTVVELEFDGDEVTARAGSATADLEPGGAAILLEFERTFTVAGYIDALREHLPNLQPLDTLTPEAQSATAARLGADENGIVTLRARIWVFHRGYATWGDLDLTTLRAAAIDAAHRGDWPRAESLFDELGRMAPAHTGDATAAERVREARENGEVLHRLAGRVRLPEFDETQRARQEERTRRLGPGRIAVARPGDPDGAYLAAAPLEDGGYELHLPPGEYRVVTFIPGFSRREESLTLSADAGLDFSFEIHDWRP